MSEINPSPVFDHPDRHVGFRGAFNFRDLGGYRGHGGKSVKWRTLFRADALHRLDEVELDELAALGMRSVLDLRTATEVDHGRIEADHLGILHLHFPVLGQAWEPKDLDPEADAGDVLGSLYIEMLTVGAPALANSLRTIASVESLPAVFHCAAGKDRTGVLAAMVLSLVGVDEETIVGDYSLTGIAMDSLVERLKQDSPEALTAMNNQPSAYLATPPEAMTMFLAHVNSTYGSMTDYVNHIGIESDVIASLQANLLD